MDNTLLYYDVNALEFNNSTLNVEFKEERDILLKYLKDGYKNIKLRFWFGKGG